eukprot:6212168-Pleurochrysis_carterae.AAC.4
MRTRGALALRSPSCWKLAHDGRRCPLSHLLEPPHRCAPAPAPPLAPSPPTSVFIYFRWLSLARLYGSNSGSSR